MRQIGRPLRPREDERFITGQGRYLDDIDFAGALHARFVRAPLAHARIVSIDCSAAASLPGVVMVATGADLGRLATPLRMAPPIEGLLAQTIAPMPVDKVRFVGDLVAVVVAHSRRVADDAAERVAVAYDPVPAVASFAAATAPGAALVDEALGTNLISRQRFATGDLTRVFADADRVVEARFHQQRQTHAPMETRSCCAIWDKGRQHLTFHAGNQAPHPLRTALAARLRLDESQVSVICPDIGGAFGQKIALSREELAVAALSRALGRAVRWREERSENLLAAYHAREESVTSRAAVTRDGRILALDLQIRQDFGAYAFYPANYMARMVVMNGTGPYRIANYGFDVEVALTNKCGSAPMRAPMAIISWVIEGTIEAIARDLGLDPIDVRRVNTLTSADLPYTMATGDVLRDVTPRATLEAGISAFDVEAFRRRQATDRGNGVYRGLGICSVMESTTYSSAFYRAAGIPGSGHEAGWVKVAPSGAVDASVGLMGSGQGYETALAQTVADGLGVDAEAVRIRLGHTDIAPYGMGTRGARGGTAGGSVAFLAGQALQRKICTIAAHLLGLNSGDELRLVGGRLQREIDRVWTDAGLGLTDIARIAYLDPLRLPPGMEPGLEAHRAWDPPATTYSNAAHFCEVLVDPETGLVTPVRYLLSEDCGTVLNPLVVEGQQHGAVAMGLSGALREHVVYDAAGQNLTGSFADYAMSVAADLPAIEIVSCHTPSTGNPIGAKGMSEGGVMGAIGAVSLAVNDALAPFGVVVERLPLTPAAVRRLLDSGR